MSVKLYGFWRSLAAYRVRVALKLKGIDYQEIPVNLLAGGQHDPAYLAINPQGAVPAFRACHSLCFNRWQSLITLTMPIHNRRSCQAMQPSGLACLLFAMCVPAMVIRSWSPEFETTFKTP